MKIKLSDLWFANWLLILAIAGCANPPAYLPTSGPSRTQVTEQNTAALPIPVLDVDDVVARRVGSATKGKRFGDVFGQAGQGDRKSVV